MRHSVQASKLSMTTTDAEARNERLGLDFDLSQSNAKVRARQRRLRVPLSGRLVQPSHPLSYDRLPDVVPDPRLHQLVP